MTPDEWLLIALELLSIAGVIIFARIDWPRVLHLPVPSVKPSSRASRHVTPAQPKAATDNSPNRV